LPFPRDTDTNELEVNTVFYVAAEGWISVQIKSLLTRLTSSTR